MIVEPETVLTWHRKGFRLFWTRKGRQAGRPSLSREVRDLIRRMCRENPLWGAPRIRGELLKLGIDIGETSVSKYMLRPHSSRTHLSLAKETPERRTVQPPADGRVVGIPHLAGLHHRYERRAAWTRLDRWRGSLERCV